MFSGSNFFVEFLSESNFLLASSDHGGKFSDLLSPLKNYLHKQNDVISFSLARYCGASTRISFFTEWRYQTNKLILDSRELVEENRDYLKKKVPVNLKGVPILNDLVDVDVFDFFLPWQLSFLQSKNTEMLNDLISKNQHVLKYLSPSYLSNSAFAELRTRQALYSEKPNLSSYISAQSERLSFIMIGLPCLLGFLHNFYGENSPINPNNIQWVLVEEILKNISFLHQTSGGNDFQAFIYQLKLDDKDKFRWFQMDKKSQNLVLVKDEETINVFKETREKIYKKTKESVETLIFPEKYKEVFKDLLDWSYALGR